MMRCGRHAKGGSVTDDHVYVAVNAHWEAHDLELPALPEGQRWHLFADTGTAVHPVGDEPELEHPGRFHLQAHSAVVLVGRAARRTTG